MNDCSKFIMLSLFIHINTCKYVFVHVAHMNAEVSPFTVQIDDYM